MLSHIFGQTFTKVKQHFCQRVHLTKYIFIESNFLFLPDCVGHAILFFHTALSFHWKMFLLEKDLLIWSLTTMSANVYCFFVSFGVDNVNCWTIHRSLGDFLFRGFYVWVDFGSRSSTASIKKHERYVWHIAAAVI